MSPYDVLVPEPAQAGAVLLHPHPDLGGDRHNLVVAALFEGLPERGVAACRFDFTSAERDLAAAAAVAALDHLAAAAPPGVPLVLAGYSFGADVAGAVLDDRVAGWFLAAPPLRLVAAAAADPRPKLLAVPEHDQFSPPPRVRHATQGWAATTVEVVAGADHFLAGRTGPVVEACAAFAVSLAQPAG